MIKLLQRLFGAKKPACIKADVSGSAEYVNKEKGLGKCKQCSRLARWETHTAGNLCNTCYDYLCGLE